ncbi:MAG: alpha/beta fold hydrolase [Betaproteobacteria bacterium]|nr:alpha/beta fold hydrolase [Betaproteobacteria bacterium]
MNQQIRFCKSFDGTRIAYAVTGKGPPLVKAPHWLTHLEYEFRSPLFKPWTEALSKDHTLFRMDARASGLSDWDVADISFEAWVRDFEAVVDAVGLERFALFGASQGAPIAIEYAVRHPERVSHLVISGGWARGSMKRGLPPERVAEFEAELKLVEARWGRDDASYRQMFAMGFAPGATLEQINSLSELQRAASSPQNAVRMMRTFSMIDVRESASRVACPTLLFHGRGDRRIPFEEGRILAGLIPGARMVPLETENHILLAHEPAFRQFFDELRAFVPRNAGSDEGAARVADAEKPDKLPRKLAAIFSADVKGYSRLMGEDEEATVRTMTALRKDASALIGEHAGRVVDSPGDNVLGEFPSAVEAVRCAVKLQQQVKARNEQVPENRRMEFRIGIHLGDVIVDGERIYGDGVNIAARLEGLAEAGGVLISESVRLAVGSRLPFAYEPAGEHRLKNIAEPVRAYRLRVDESSAPAPPPERPLPDKPSIVVLPFENMSGEPEQGYFSDGMADDIITDLSKVSGLLVIARNSAFAYKDRRVDVRQIGRELGVRHVLEGSVRKAGNRIRVTAQLIDSATGGHLWAERYDRDLTGIFEVQDELTQRIVAALKVHLTPEESRRLRRQRTDNLAAYDLFLRGREQFMRQSRNGTAAARPLLEQAVALDPGFAAAYATLAGTHLLDFVNGWSNEPRSSLERAKALGEKAMALDPSEPYAHFIAGGILLYTRRVDEAIERVRRAVELDPNFAVGYVALTQHCHFAGRNREALAYAEKALVLDPLAPDILLHFTGCAHFVLGDYERAAALFRERIARNPETDISRVWLAACLGKLGRAEEARGAWGEALRANPGFSIEQRRAVLPYKNPADFEKVIEGLRAAGI